MTQPTREFHKIGPPGTGKTTTLSGIICATVDKHGPDSVVVSSFTKAAATEIAGRDLGGIQESNVGTLHALCYRALGRPKNAESKAAEWNAHAALHAPEFRLSLSKSASAVDDPYGSDGSDLDENSRGRTEGDDALQRVNMLRAKVIPRAAWPEREAAFDDMWSAWKRANSYLDFTDFISEALSVGISPPSGARFGFFDECQDWSPLELALVRHWADELEGIMLCYDADQCLYTFKGASPSALEMPGMPEENFSSLEQSHRVPIAVHALARSWIKESNRRRDWPYLPRPHPGEVVSCEMPLVAAEPVVDSIEEELAEGRDAMIIAPCAFMLQPLLRALRARGIAFHNPYRKANGAWNPMRGGVERLMAFMLPVRPDLFFDTTTRPRLWTWSELWRWVEVMRSDATCIVRGMKTLVEAKAKDPDSNKRFVTQEDGLAVFGEQNWNSLRDAFRMTKPWRWLDERVMPSKAALLDYALTICERGCAGALASPPRVVVGTVHSVKGGQADTVFLAPDLSQAGYSEWLAGGEQQDSVRRMFYVGMTRAKEKLVLLSPATPTSVELR